jgi:hypothetical protein
MKATVKWWLFLQPAWRNCNPSSLTIPSRVHPVADQDWNALHFFGTNGIIGCPIPLVMWLELTDMDSWVADDDTSECPFVALVQDMSFAFEGVLAEIRQVSHWLSSLSY